MYTIITHLKFQDYDTWKKGFDATHALRASGGITNVRPYRLAGGANEAIVIGETDDLERVKAFFSSPDARAGFERAGITEPPTVEIVEPI
jgi:hypothetical protein